MVREAEEARRVRDRVEACNRLENYVYRVRSVLKDGGGVGGKIGEDDRERMDAALSEALEWFEEQDSGRAAEKEGYEERMKEVEQVYEKSGTGADGEADDDDVNEL
jgi:endoplasmic reticulum chaperone BiP